MKNQIKQNLTSFLLPFITIWAVGLMFLLLKGKIDTHLILNSYHTPALDTFFRYFTEIGGWFPFAVAGILLIFKQWRISLTILLGQLITTLFVTPLKRIIHAPRPAAVFNDLGIDLPIVEGIDLHTTLSFPSGHTAAVFALCFALALYCPRWWQKALCLLFALLGAYSRIYLSQHFLADTLAGSLIGILSILIVTKLKIKEHKFPSIIH